MVKQKLVLNISSGGNGDIWMRMISLYAISAISNQYKIVVLVPSFMHNLLNFTFGDRIQVTSESVKPDYSYTSLGFKDLIKKILSGEKFVVPYQRAVIHDKPKKQIKDFINILLFDLSNFAGVAKLPDWKCIENYQGYLEINGLKQFKNISYEKFVDQLSADFQQLRKKLNLPSLPVSPEFVISKNLNNKIVVFPTGTSRQFIPVWWAKKYLPDACYAFFIKDNNADEFIRNGLQVVYFYKEPGDIISLSLNARWTLSTDSFPSHLLQTVTDRCTITITEVLKSRIIAPTFQGKVVDAVAPCHPCLHLDRKSHIVCMAGHTECLNWKNNDYSENIVKSVK